MSVTAVIGMQWGDEGKGKIVDRLAKDADFVVRFHGGANAGHTVMNRHGKFALHLVPSGIFHRRAKCIIANGTAVDPAVLRDEMRLLERSGIRLRGRLFVSPRAHVVLRQWKLQDRRLESKRGKRKIGTTGRGIGPTYAAKSLRMGVRVSDFVTTKQGKFLKPYVKETFLMLCDALERRKRVLAEGAHGILLDIDWGTYPYVTSSNILPGALHAAAGIPPQEITRVIGVAKAYQTRVGAGPMPTELKNKTGDMLREKGGEFGTTTGRPRRCGWLDLEALKYACELVRPTELALTKLDVLDGFKTIKVGVGYRLGGRRVSFAESTTEELGRVSVVYRTLAGWPAESARVKRPGQLPRQARRYIDFIEGFAGVPIRYISVGPERNQMFSID